MSKFRFQSVQNNSRAKESEPISERNTGLAEANTLVLLPGLAEAIGLSDGDQVGYDGPSKFDPLRNFPFQIKLYKFRSGAKGNILENLKISLITSCGVSHQSVSSISLYSS